MIMGQRFVFSVPKGAIPAILAITAQFVTQGTFLLAIIYVQPALLKGLSAKYLPLPVSHALLTASLVTAKETAFSAAY